MPLSIDYLTAQQECRDHYAPSEPAMLPDYASRIINLTSLSVDRLQRPFFDGAVKDVALDITLTERRRCVKLCREYEQGCRTAHNGQGADAAKHLAGMILAGEAPG